MQDRQAQQALIKAARDRHAALFKELRADQQAAKQIAKPDAAPKVSKGFAQEARPTPPSMDERIERLRNGERSPRRGRDMDRER